MSIARQLLPSGPIFSEICVASCTDNFHFNANTSRSLYALFTDPDPYDLDNSTCVISFSSAEEDLADDPFIFLAVINILVKNMLKTYARNGPNSSEFLTVKNKRQKVSDTALIGLNVENSSHLTALNAIQDGKVGRYASTDDISCARRCQGSFQGVKLRNIHICVRNVGLTGIQPVAC
ncbi:hypothetical protein C8R42DRAFT_642826 [Lentinula raphanica]|nr:hypothetical protein C8R42DRAFT_642826 [Lentinula raphanica]